MGERTLAKGSASQPVSYRTATPDERLAADDTTLGRQSRNYRNYGSYVPEIEVKRIVSVRAEPKYNARSMEDLIAQQQTLSEEVGGRLRDAIVLERNHTAPVFAECVAERIDLARISQKIRSAYSAELASTNASAVMTTDEQTSTNCCPCPPCNLL
ncbi:MAG: hypothetical protein ACJ8G3_05945 [Burkholderiaceae bacterium]